MRSTPRRRSSLSDRLASRGQGKGLRRPSRSAGRVIVREATARDLPVLVVHRRRMWRAIGRRNRAELDAHDRRYRRWFATERAADRLRAFVAVDAGDGRVLGSGALWLTPSQPRPGPRSRDAAPYLLSMFTEPSARGRGVASHLVRAMVAWSRVHGFLRITLHASKMGRSVYERLGFVSTNEMRLELRAPRRRQGLRTTARRRH